MKLRVWWVPIANLQLRQIRSRVLHSSRVSHFVSAWALQGVGQFESLGTRFLWVSQCFSGDPGHFTRGFWGQIKSWKLRYAVFYCRDLLAFACPNYLWGCCRCDEVLRHDFPGFTNPSWKETPSDSCAIRDLVVPFFFERMSTQKQKNKTRNYRATVPQDTLLVGLW